MSKDQTKQYHPFQTQPEQRCAAVVRVIVDPGSADGIIAGPIGMTDTNKLHDFVARALRAVEARDGKAIAAEPELGSLIDAVHSVVQKAMADSVRVQLLNVLDPDATRAVMEQVAGYEAERMLQELAQNPDADINISSLPTGGRPC